MGSLSTFEALLFARAEEADKNLRSSRRFLDGSHRSGPHGPQVRARLGLAGSIFDLVGTERPAEPRSLSTGFPGPTMGPRNLAESTFSMIVFWGAANLVQAGLSLLEVGPPRLRDTAAS